MFGRCGSAHAALLPHAPCRHVRANVRQSHQATIFHRHAGRRTDPRPGDARALPLKDNYKCD
jgi:hypothetical protein